MLHACHCQSVMIIWLIMPLKLLNLFRAIVKERFQIQWKRRFHILGTFPSHLKKVELWNVSFMQKHNKTICLNKIQCRKKLDQHRYGLFVGTGAT